MSQRASAGMVSGMTSGMTSGCPFPPNWKKIAWNAARTTGNPVYPHGGSSFILFSVAVKVLPVSPLLSGVFVHRAFCSYFLRIERVVEMRRLLWWTQ